jgi:hypothetical protein
MLYSKTVGRFVYFYEYSSEVFADPAGDPAKNESRDGTRLKIEILIETNETLAMPKSQTRAIDPEYPKLSVQLSLNGLDFGPAVLIDYRAPMIIASSEISFDGRRLLFTSLGRIHPGAMCSVGTEVFSSNATTETG